MFSLFSKLTEYVVGSVKEQGSSNTYSVVKPPKYAKENVTVKTEDDSEKKSLLRKSCYGKVTRLYDGAGVIDGEVYFTFDVIIGGSRLEVGSEVHLEAARDNVNAGWKAIHVTVFNEWGRAQENGEIESIIGMATAVKADILELNNETTFNLSTLKHQSYYPCKGDWVRVELEKFKDDSFEIRGVKPVREKNLTGKVNSVFPGYGYINEDVYFTFGVCIRGYRPCCGDDVKVSVVESAQGKCKWRALLVQPKSYVKQNSQAIGNLQQFMGNKMTELLSDKHGLVITGTLGFGDVPMGQSRTLCLCIKNTGNEEHTFKSCLFVRPDPQFEIQLLHDATPSSIPQDPATKITPNMLSCGMEIPSQETRCINVTFTAKCLGRVKQLIVFTFECGDIGRYITSNVMDDLQNSLAPAAPYQRNRTGRREAWDSFVDSGSKERWIVPGERPVRKTKIFFPIKLKLYSIPKDIRRCIMEDRDLTVLVPALTEALVMQNHSTKFSTLLYAEELQMEFDMREFDLQNVTMDLYKEEFLSLHVPGLAEGRPSLLIGDTVVVSLTDDGYGAPKYEGYIYDVRKDDILLKFNEQFHKNFGLQSCYVTFYFKRSTLRRSHQAVEFASQLGPEVMFPRKLDSKLPIVNLYFGPSVDSKTVEAISKTKDFLYNCNLNERQRAAVSRILSGQCRPTPYILFGPPGTGKTVTLVEAILQAYHRIPASRIIACAPSNSAADLLATRLHKSGFVQEGDMVRLNAAQRSQDIPEAIIPYCLDTDSLTLAAHHRIIISTCSTSGQLFSLGLRAGHFTHVFVDEAGQATEPECLIPIGLAAGGEGQIILAGDPHQLGPVLRSDLALEHGLNISLLERLMSRPLYTRDEARFLDHGSYDPLLVTKLVNNYRSHPVLLNLPSALFYHNELQVHADKTTRESFSQFEMLPNKGVPLVFHGIKGENLREGNSPSWFNAAEAVQIIRYVQGLKKSEVCSIKPTDIGIISPYKKQVEKIRLLLKRVGVDDIKVGSVEEFQGQERPVIIISTVRSNQSFVGSDVDRTIGFLGNPKRFNVAITRAQSLLIVIGNPHVLCQDPYWCSLVHYCVMNDVYTGCDLPDLDSEFYQDEFRFAINVLSKIITEDENAGHVSDNNKPTKDDRCPAHIEGASDVTYPLDQNVDNSQSIDRHPSGNGLKEINGTRCDPGIPESLIDKRKCGEAKGNLVLHTANKRKSNASDELESISRVSVSAQEHQYCSNTGDQVSRFHGNGQGPRADRYESDSSHSLSKNVINGSNLQASIESPSSIETFLSGHSSTANTTNQISCASSTSGVEVQSKQLNHYSEYNEEYHSYLPDVKTIPCVKRISKNLELSNHLSALDGEFTALGLPVGTSAMNHGVDTISTTLVSTGELSDEEDLEEFLIRPMT